MPLGLFNDVFHIAKIKKRQMSVNGCQGLTGKKMERSFRDVAKALS
jgi:hypothetical protein